MYDVILKRILESKEAVYYSRLDVIKVGAID